MELEIIKSNIEEIQNRKDLNGNFNFNRKKNSKIFFNTFHIYCVTIMTKIKKKNRFDA